MRAWPSRLAWSFLVLLLTLPNGTLAGSAEDPEVTDPADQDVEYFDITKGWIATTDDPTSFEIAIELVDVPPTGGINVGFAPAVLVAYYVPFLTIDPNGDAVAADAGEFDHSFVFASADPTPNPTAWYCQRGRETGGTYTRIDQIPCRIDGNLIIWTVPRALDTIMVPDGDGAAGWSIDAFWAFSALLPRAPVAGGVIQQVDLAPDSGVGRPYFFPGPSSATAPEAVVEVLEGETATVSLTFEEATTASHAYSWATDLASAVAEYNIEVTSGSVALKIADGAGTVVVAVNATETAVSSVPIEGAVAGNWTIQIETTDFVGSIDLTLAAPSETTEEEAGGPDEEQGGESSGEESGSEASTEGEEPTDEGGGLPNVGLVAVAGAVAVAALILRRRNEP